MDQFVSAAAYGGEQVTTPLSNISREALEVLLQLGETRTEAIKWIDQAMRDPDNRPDDAEELVRRVYQIKSGG